MALYGLPDFDQPFQGDGFQVFLPFEGGDATLLPDELQVATAPDGRSDFLLELVRRQGRFSTTDAYGRLDMRLAPRDRTDDALAALREVRAAAMLRPARFASGFLRLQLLRLPGEPPLELPAPVALAADSLVTHPVRIELTPTLAALIKGALQGQLLALSAVAELAVLGVSPRLSLTVQFNPAALLGALLALTDDQRRITRDAIAGYFRRDPATLPIQVGGTLPDDAADRFAQSMADRVLARFGTFVAAPAEPIVPTFALAAPDQIPDGSFTWDLAEPCQALRPAVLRLDPLLAAREVVQANGIAAVYRETTVPAFPTGTLAVTALANLPDQRPGVLEIGVTLSAPPRPPLRPQAAIATATLTPPDDWASIALTLGGGAPPEYRYSTYVVLQQGSGVDRLETGERDHTGGWLSLAPDDFPVDFVTVAADRALLDLATVQGTLAWGLGDAQSTRAFKLDRDMATVALALPKAAAEPTLTFEAAARVDGRVARLGPLPAEHLQLGMYSFAEYGPHTLAATCVFDDASQICAIELLPEDRQESDGPLALLVFTPDRPAKTWTWFARSLFAPGYRYRPRCEPGTPPAPWSEVRSPFEPLTIRSSQLEESAAIRI